MGLFTAVFLALTAGWFGYNAMQERRRVEETATRARLAQSRYLAGFAQEKLNRGDVDAAIALGRIAAQRWPAADVECG